MNKKYLILSLLLVFFISAGQSLGENANNSSIIAVADLKYIWSVTGIESEKITMVLNQDAKISSARPSMSRITAKNGMQRSWAPLRGPM